MNVSTGTHLGPYEILSRLGAGGMGEVFKAHDSRLDRSVAIKVLPREFADNAPLRLRFEREAKTISQLNHPNICTLHDIGREDGVDYLVLELLEGVSLADRIVKGPLPLKDVLKYGVEIASALDKAHRSGVVHRDLKPGNIMITKSGAKLLDFGLAKGGASVSTDVLQGATAHKPLTQEGTIIGTVQYMAPEQLEGEEADARTDIFAFGAVLYEMATGKRAFEGKTKTSLIAAIVQSEPPPMSAIQPLTPPAFEHVVKKCLAKDRDDRWQSAHDLAEELRWISEAGSSSGVATPLFGRRKSVKRMAALLVIAIAVSAMIAATVALRYRPAEPVMMSSIALPLHPAFDRFGQAALSPNGTQIAFVANIGGPTFDMGMPSTLWIRSIDQITPRLLPGTQGANEPFWSPDGKEVGFFAEGKLKRISIDGGPSQIICDAPQAWGGSWNQRGVIIFSKELGGANAPLYRVNANGGTPQPLTQLGPHDDAHRWPVFFPDGDHFIFLADAVLTENHRIKIGSIRDGSSQDLMQGVTNAIFVEPDSLLFVRAGSLMVQKFDVKHLSLEGEPRLIADQIIQNDANHHFEFSASSNGRLLYRTATMDRQLTWLDRAGKTVRTLTQPSRLGFKFRISPDRRRLIVEHFDRDGRSDDLWLVDATRGTTTRFTFDPAADYQPIWSADGSKIAFSSMRNGHVGDLYTAEVANPSNVQRLAPSAVDIQPTAWSRDGQFILLNHSEKSNSNILVFSTRTQELRAYIATPFNEGDAIFSPDDSAIAYVSDESGRPEVYVEGFPTHAGKRQISTTGGVQPRWRADGRELFYIALGGQLTSVDMTADPAAPQPLFQLPGNSFDVTSDGQLFIVDQPVDDPFKLPLTFVSNWTAQRR